MPITEYHNIGIQLYCLLCRSNTRKAHGSAALYGLSQSLIFFSYAAIFTFGAWLIINRDLNFEDMFK